MVVAELLPDDRLENVAVLLTVGCRNGTAATYCFVLPRLLLRSIVRGPPIHIEPLLYRASHFIT